MVRCGPAGATGGCAPAWPASQHGGRDSAQPDEQRRDRQCERETDGDAPERAGESWQLMSACASGFEHVERARLDNTRASRMADRSALCGAPAHVGCFVERAPTPPGGGDQRGRGALPESAVRRAVRIPKEASWLTRECGPRHLAAGSCGMPSSRLRVREHLCNLNALEHAIVGDVQCGEPHRSTSNAPINDGSSGLRSCSRPDQILGRQSPRSPPTCKPASKPGAAERERSRKRTGRNT